MIRFAWMTSVLLCLFVNLVVLNLDVVYIKPRVNAIFDLLTSIVSNCPPATISIATNAYSDGEYL